ncbi:TPM domain-containing protein [Sphingomonas sp. ABOLE]|uniref:TPM domain-containing protein n=1 Tax=Sphingomonas sp. ABOLE TaxID=1985878 RepID=UPI000F7EA9A7|nr:TPM domain-containing protein [Sphingomonas sp. ABOLE]RSV42480.1 TPM domain-containing protein [Sphingomonas sp. ABOLE]
MRVLRFLVLLVALLAGATSALADPTFPKLTGRVVDDAHLLSPAQVAQLTQLSAEVEQASSRQFVVATLPDLQGYDIADYGYQLGRAWGIGQKEANNGILLIVAPNERKVRIEVGYGLEPIMTDALSSQIINQVILPKFKAGDMAGGIVAGAQAIAEQMKQPLEAAEQKAKAAQDAATKSSARKRQGGGLPIGLLFWFIILVVILVPMLARFGGRRRPGPWDGQAYRARDNDSGMLPIVLWTIANEIGRAASHRDDDDDHGGWGGGGWGGGGGGGGFSGGGGSFGGGGASGSW